MFTEDYRISGDSLQETMFFHVDSGKLASVLEHLKDGRSVDGKDLAQRVEFIMGSGVESPLGEKRAQAGHAGDGDHARTGNRVFPDHPHL